ncbi:unnamed protein product [Ceutorhynchus assimilis]|uniref:beta-mannosidase n=1 Tax=Ceutorhynchus assimilis TaxID=467358 RepID=A0A9N9MLF9_9CUCU|nr:unnamed protein product [Ceutorhynchus assimilis]
MLRLLASFALLVAGCHGKAAVTQSLDGTWAAKETEHYYEFPASVPGGIYTDLMKLDMIGDIFYGFNDSRTRWVGNINWTYILNFEVEKGLMDYDTVNLVFEGVDTFASIELNGVVIGETQNMFVRYVYDVKNFLKAQGNNTIKIFFANPVEMGLALNYDQLDKYRIPWECPPDAYQGECHINMLRKMQASFSWDWGPSFPSMGLWKPVYIQAFDEAAFQHVVHRVVDSGKSWNIYTDVYFENNQRGYIQGELTLKLYIDTSSVISKTFNVKATVNENGELATHAQIDLINKTLIKEWWPNGYGDQPLYKLEVIFASGENNEDIISDNKLIGFRTVELVQEPLATGATFYFKVNGQVIFAKGSNEIPINILPELGQDRDTIDYLLQSAKDVNMNMLRVWGGGVYESDYFYEVADRLGIMIWQDFMFACSLYPATEKFLNNVLAEVDHNIKRLHYHPSIVVYSGNNENEGVLVDNWYGTQDNFTQYKLDYVDLYINTIRKEFNRITRNEAIFISSSPSNGNLTESQGWIGESPGNQYWGDVHFYNYALDPWDSNTYPIPRFCSEYGYQSLPSEDTWFTATNDKADLVITSHFMDWRQHHPGGNAEMIDLIAENLNIPDNETEAYTTAFIYLSQVYNSQAIKVETEHYRRYRSYLTDDGRGYTMGALYWQLNDVWVAPTWSSIDYTLRWKMLHYFAKNFFANVIVTGHINDARELQVYTVNDQLSPENFTTAIIRVYKYNSPDFVPLLEMSFASDLKAGASQLFYSTPIDDLLEDLDCDKNSCFFHFVVQNNASVAISPENYAFPGKLKDSSVASANVQISSVTQSGDNTFDVTVTSDNIALFVWLDSHAIRGTFSENGFLQVVSSKVVSFTSSVNITVGELKEALSVTHLKDSKWN